MKKRSSILWWLAVPAVVVLVLLGGIFGRSRFHGEASFGFANANGVRRLALEQGGQRVVLSKRGGSWVINGGEEAQQDKVADVLYALQMLEVKHPLPAGTSADSLRGNGLCVAVSGRLGTLRRYTLYRVDTLTVGVVRAGQPYALQVRGNDGLDVLSLLDAAPAGWRKTLLLSLLPTQIAAVTVEDLGNPGRSFTLRVDTLGAATLLALYSGEEFTHLHADRVRRYLSYFRGLSVERYATGLSEETVLPDNAAYILTVASHSGDARVMRIFYMPVGDELDAFGRPTSVNLNRCYLQQDDDPGVAIALWVDFDLLMKDIAFFVR